MEGSHPNVGNHLNADRDCLIRANLSMPCRLSGTEQH